MHVPIIAWFFGVVRRAWVNWRYHRRHDWVRGDMKKRLELL